MSGRPASSAGSRPARLAPALGVAVLAAALYASTLCRSVYWYDSAEYVTAAYTLGVPHPPGYPLYTLIAHAFTLLPLPVALSVNALSALSAVFALLLLYAVCRELAAAPLAAAGAALWLAVAPAFWFNASVAEVYTPGLCFTLGVLWLALRAQALGEPRLALAGALLAGLGLGVHYSLATCGAGYLLLIAGAAWPADPVGPADARARRVGIVAAQCAIAVLLGASVFVYVAVRGASEDAVPNYGSPPTLARFLWLVSGGNYAQWFGAGRSVGEHVAATARALHAELGAVGLLGAVLGLWTLARRERLRAWALGLALLGNIGFFLSYRVPDSEVFLLPAVALSCALCAVAIDALATRLELGGFGRRIAPRRPKTAELEPRARARAPALAALWLAVLPAFAVVRALQDYPARDLSTFRDALDYGERLSAQLPRGAVVLNYTTPAEWRYDAVFGMYMKHVLGRRPDVVVVKQVGPPVIDRLLAERRPLFMYAPVPELARLYRLEPAGDVFRVVGRR